jgi:hypothetical protein
LVAREEREWELYPVRNGKMDELVLSYGSA